MKEFTFDQLNERYDAMTIRCVAECQLVTDLVGGVPGTPEAISAYVRHQLKLEGKEAEEALARILTHEVDVTRTLPVPEGAELEEKENKSVNLIRRDEHGPWLGDWMIKACLKAAASRIGLFQQTRGSKGDMAEMGSIRSAGVSLREVKLSDADHWRYDGNRIYLRAADKDEAAPTEMQFFKGRVSSPQGSVSIVTLSECCLAGARFGFEYRFYNGNIVERDVTDFFAAAMIVGLGSAKSFERGKFRINRLTMERPEKISRKAVTKTLDIAAPVVEEAQAQRAN